MQHLLDMNTTVARNPDMICGDLDGETVMMSMESGSYYSLNLTGGRVWDLLDQPKTVAEICHAMLEEYNVTADECQSEVTRFLGELLKRGVLVENR